MNTAQRRDGKARARLATENADHTRSRRLKRLRRARALCLGIGLPLLLIFATTPLHLPRYRAWDGHWMTLSGEIFDLVVQLPLFIFIACGVPESVGRIGLGVASLACLATGLVVVRTLRRETAVGRTGVGAEK